jgi:hypothetical protein
MVEGERFRWLTAKAHFVVDHVEVDWLRRAPGFWAGVQAWSCWARELASPMLSIRESWVSNQ